MSTPVTQTEPFSVTSDPSSQSSRGGGEMPHDSATGNEYLSTGLVGNVSNTNEGDSPSDLATQLMNEYAAAQDPSSALASTSIGGQLSATDTLTNKTSEA